MVFHWFCQITPQYKQTSVENIIIVSIKTNTAPIVTTKYFSTVHWIVIIFTFTCCFALLHQRCVIRSFVATTMCSATPALKFGWRRTASARPAEWPSQQKTPAEKSLVIKRHFLTYYIILMNIAILWFCKSVDLGCFTIWHLGLYCRM